MKRSYNTDEISDWVERSIGTPTLDVPVDADIYFRASALGSALGKLANCRRELERARDELKRLALPLTGPCPLCGAETKREV